MTNEILEKMNKFMSKPYLFQAEEDVVYFLVEMRKLLDILKITDKHKIVKFYADWALHPSKSQNLDYIDHIISRVNQNPSKGGSEFVLMDDLKMALSKLLTEVKLSNFTISEDLWVYFFYYLAKVLNDQPILWNNRASSRIEYLKFSLGSRTKLIYLDIKIKGTEIPLHYASGKYIRLLEKKGLNLN